MHWNGAVDCAIYKPRISPARSIEPYKSCALPRRGLRHRIRAVDRTGSVDGAAYKPCIISRGLWRHIQVMHQPGAVYGTVYVRCMGLTQPKAPYSSQASGQHGRRCPASAVHQPGVDYGTVFKSCISSAWSLAPYISLLLVWCLASHS